MIEPNFLVLGAAKAGTTWLYYCLKEHPEIFVPSKKELNFFCPPSNYESNYEKGIEWYKAFFSNYSGEKAVGEVSPSYMFPLEVPERIYAWNPNVRLLFILRNPIERAYSDYCMNLDHGIFSKDVDREMSLDSRIVIQGLYYDQITRFTNFFSKEQIKILIYDDLKTNPKLFLEDVYSFLEVNCLFNPNALNRYENPKKPLPKFESLYKFIRLVYQEISKRSSYSKKAIDELKRKGYFDVFYAVTRGEEHPRMSRSTEQILARFYREDVDALSHLIGRDLSFWLKPYLQN